MKGRTLEPPEMKATEYSVDELKTFLDEMSGKYALARVVDLIECRIIELGDDGKININESCYGIWNAEQKCINCSSAMACRIGCHQEKAEHFKDSYYFIQSNPVKLKLANGSVYDAVVMTGLIEKYGVDSRLLRLEITETAILRNPDQYDAVVEKLRQKGFLVEIDDFGKDNSSLNLLKDIKADVLKIDMSFLREIRERERSRIILKSVIGMADSLGMEVITEGVETEQQLHVLSEMGCSHFQGYYFSRPISVDEFEEKYTAFK